MTHHYHQQYFENNQQLRDRPAIRWYARVCHRLLGAGPRDVFEFGCGVGWLLYHLSPHHRVSGYDLSEFCREQAAAKTPAARIYETMDVVPRGAFDLVVTLHVLEHIAEPAPTIREVAGLLRPGGWLLLVVPALGGLGHRMKKERWFAYRDDTHVSLLAEEEWRMMVEQAGLGIVQMAGDGLWDPPYVTWLPRFVQWPLFGAPAALQVYLARGRLILPAGWSECLILVARKPGAERGPA